MPTNDSSSWWLWPKAGEAIHRNVLVGEVLFFLHSLVEEVL
jgi:hypothetical protein